MEAVLLMRIQHRHQSLNTRMAKENPEAVVDWLGECRGRCRVLTGTEGDQGDLLGAPGWGVFREPGDFRRGDPWVSWETSVWQKRDGFVEQLSDETYDGRRPHAAVVRLRHIRTDERVVFISTHMPAHVGDRLRTARETTSRERAYNDALATLRDIVRGLRAVHPNRHVVLAGDWNISLKTRFAERLFADAFRGTGLHMVPIPRDVGGTFGRRLIDWAFTDLASSGDVLERTDASDHRGVAFIHED